MPIEPERVRVLNSEPVREGARYVLYWAQMNRRAASNQALAHAAQIANENNLPLLVYEGLTFSYPNANDRLHTFMLEAVPGTARDLKRVHAGYFFGLRARRTQPGDLLYRLAERARCVVTDDYPAFIAAAHNSRVPGKIGVRYCAVDASCIVPMSRHQKRAYAAYTIRPKIARELPAYLRPVEDIRLKRRWSDDLLPPESAELRTQVTAWSRDARSTIPSGRPFPSPAAPRPRTCASKFSSNSGSLATHAKATSRPGTRPATSVRICTSARSRRSKLHWRCANMRSGIN